MTTSSPVLNLSPTQFRKKMTSGRTEPYLIEAIDDSGTSYEIVIKLRGRDYGYAQQTCELIGGQLARLLGLSAPSVAVVDVHHDFVNLVPQQFQQVFHDSMGANFGTEFIGPGASVWPQGMKLKPSERCSAAAIFAFDVLVQNPDRRVENPNLLVKADAFYAIDNEQAFSLMVVPIIGGFNYPWTPEFVTNGSRFVANHVFYRQLRSHGVTLEQFEQRLQGITDDEVSNMIRSVPTEWRNDRDIPTMIGEYTIAARKHASSFRSVVEFLLQ